MIPWEGCGAGSQRFYSSPIACTYSQNGDSTKARLRLLKLILPLQTRKQSLSKTTCRSERTWAERMTLSEKELRGSSLSGSATRRVLGDSQPRRQAFSGRTTQQMKARLKVPNSRPLADFLPRYNQGPRTRTNHQFQHQRAPLGRKLVSTEQSTTAESEAPRPPAACTRAVAPEDIRDRQRGSRNRKAAMRVKRWNQKKQNNKARNSFSPRPRGEKRGSRCSAVDDSLCMQRIRLVSKARLVIQGICSNAGIEITSPTECGAVLVAQPVKNEEDVAVGKILASEIFGEKAIVQGDQLVVLMHPLEESIMKGTGYTLKDLFQEGRYVRITFVICQQCATVFAKRHLGLPMEFGCLVALLPGFAVPRGFSCKAQLLGFLSALLLLLLESWGRIWHREYSWSIGFATEQEHLSPISSVRNVVLMIPYNLTRLKILDVPVAMKNH